MTRAIVGERAALPRPCLALITDQARSRLPLLEAIVRAVGAEVGVVQLRAGDLAPGGLLALAREVRAITAGRALFVVHSDVGVALAVAADGVHLSERGPPAAEVRERVGGGCLVGRSVHSVAAARRAAAEGADYVQVGAVFATASHPGRAPSGLELVREVRAAVELPLIAVGGITSENAGQVMAAGADGVAVIGAILGSEDPAESVCGLRAALESGTRQ